MSLVYFGLITFALIVNANGCRGVLLELPFGPVLMCLWFFQGLCHQAGADMRMSLAVMQPVLWENCQVLTFCWNPNGIDIAVHMADMMIFLLTASVASCLQHVSPLSNSNADKLIQSCIRLAQVWPCIVGACSRAGPRILLRGLHMQ